MPVYTKDSLWLLLTLCTSVLFCTFVLLYFCTFVLLHLCTSVLLYFCTSVLLYFCTSVLLYFCTSLPFCFCTFVLLCFQKAIRQAAESIEKLANIAREELPATMAAVRLSGMEISDLTMELSDLRYNSAQSSYRPPPQFSVTLTSILLCAYLFSASILTSDLLPCCWICMLVMRKLGICILGYIYMYVSAWDMPFVSVAFKKLRTSEPANDGPHVFRKRQKTKSRIRFCRRSRSGWEAS